MTGWGEMDERRGDQLAFNLKATRLVRGEEEIAVRRVAAFACSEHRVADGA
jgi:hypothetical protein